MTQRERLLAPFRGEKPDRTAWLADLSYWYAAAESDGTLPERYGGHDGYKKLHEDLGVCYYYDYTSGLFDTVYDRVTLSVLEEGRDRRRCWSCPGGALTEHWTYLPGARCWAHDTYAVKNPQDLGILLDIYERTRFVASFEHFSRLLTWVGDAGLPLAPAPRSPLPALLADWCGVEATAFLLFDHPRIAARIMERIDKANDVAFEALVASPCQLVHFCDNLDSSASTPFFDGWMKEYYQRRVAQLHSAGKFAVVHLDGRVRGLLPKLAACGFDGVESVTPAPLGDVDIGELRTVTGNTQTIIWGGIPGAMFSPPWTRDAVRKHAEHLLEALGADGRLIVGSADQVPPDGNLTYCRLIADIVEAWEP